MLILDFFNIKLFLFNFYDLYAEGIYKDQLKSLLKNKTVNHWVYSLDTADDCPLAFFLWVWLLWLIIYAISRYMKLCDVLINSHDAKCRRRASPYTYLMKDNKSVGESIM